MKNFFQTKSNKLYFVTLNEDGSLFITSDGINSIKNAGMFILSRGGIQRVIDRCTEEITLDEFKSRVAIQNEHKQYYQDHKKKILAAQAQKNAEKQAAQDAHYKRLFRELMEKSNGVIESTYENISIVLAYLNTQNWGSWELPKMTINYRCNQYDCEGKQATTMILDKMIQVDGEYHSHFVFGAPRGHLSKYYTCQIYTA